MDLIRGHAIAVHKKLLDGCLLLIQDTPLRLEILREVTERESKLSHDRQVLEDHIKGFH